MNVPKDKVMHACAGVVVATVAVSIAALWVRNYEILAHIAVWSSFIAGVAKEAYDYFTSKGVSEYFDVLATVLGGCGVAAIVLTCL